MNQFFAVMQMLPAIIAAVKAAEDAFPMPAAGKAKLDFVISLLSIAPNVAPLVPLIVTVVNGIVASFNASGVFKKA